MLIRKSTHDRLLAEQKQLSAKVFAANLRLARQLTDANKRLAVYTGPRQRGEGGRFLPVKGAQA